MSTLNEIVNGGKKAWDGLYDRLWFKTYKEGREAILRQMSRKAGKKVWNTLIDRIHNFTTYEPDNLYDNLVDQMIDDISPGDFLH